MSELLRLILGGIFLLSGLLVFLLSLFGVYKFDFILNRMHCASLADTLGLFLLLLGLGFIAGRVSVIPKLFLILLFQWIGSPIAAHMVSRLELKTDPEAPKHLEAPKQPEATNQPEAYSTDRKGDRE